MLLYIRKDIDYEESETDIELAVMQVNKQLLTKGDIVLASTYRPDNKSSFNNFLINIGSSRSHITVRDLNFLEIEWKYVSKQFIMIKSAKNKN